jgi:hypothetical protein
MDKRPRDRTVAADTRSYKRAQVQIYRFVLWDPLSVTKDRELVVRQDYSIRGA